MAWTPKMIVDVWRGASRHARTIDHKFVLDERKMGEFGLSQDQIDGIFAEIGRIEEFEKQSAARLAALDS